MLNFLKIDYLEHFYSTLFGTGTDENRGFLCLKLEKDKNWKVNVVDDFQGDELIGLCLPELNIG